MNDTLAESSSDKRPQKHKPNPNAKRCSGTTTKKDNAMCRPASFVIANKNKSAFWSKATNSHTAIRKEHGLPENKPERIFNVAVEVVPENGDLNAPIEKWRFVVDQDMLPDWWDAAEAEKTARRELKSWDNAWLVRGVMPQVVSGQTVIVLNGGTVQKVLDGGTVQKVLDGTVQEVLDGGTVQKVWGGTVQEVWGGTVQEVWGGGTVQEVWGGTVQEVWGGGTVQKVWGGTVQEVLDGGTVQKVLDGGTVQKVLDGTVQEVLDGGTVQSYITLDKSIMQGDRSVLIERVDGEVKVYVGKQEALPA